MPDSGPCSPRDPELFAGNAVASVDLLTGQITTLSTAVEKPYGICVDEDSGTAWVTEYNKGALTRIDLQTERRRPSPEDCRSRRTSPWTRAGRWRSLPRREVARWHASTWRRAR
jgi:hypothetical protein